MFTIVGTDKAELTERAMYIIENFEPNSNYELDILIRRSNRSRDTWMLSVRLIFPHMSYKRHVRQASLYGRQIRQARIPVIPHRKSPKLYYMPRLLKAGQVTLNYFYNIPGSMELKAHA